MPSQVNTNNCFRRIVALVLCLIATSTYWMSVADAWGMMTPARHHHSQHRTISNGSPSSSVHSLSSYTTTTTTTTTKRTSSSPWRHSMAATDEGGDPSPTTTKSSLPFWLDIGTKGGAVFWSLVLFVVPILGYNFVTSVLGFDEIEAGKWIGFGFTAVILMGWVSTYLFRVATKDMTYAKQLKDYENAVIAKRLEELDDDEVQALVEEIERDEF